MAPTSKSCKFQAPENVDPPLVPIYFQLSYLMAKVCTNLQRKPKTGTGDASLLAWCEVKGEKTSMSVFVPSWSFLDASPPMGG